MKLEDNYGEAFNLGDKLDLFFSDEVRAYRTMVEDRPKNGNLVISSLFSQKEGGRIDLINGEEVTLVDYRYNGRFILRASVIGEWANDKRLVEVKPLGKFTRRQMREWVRVSINGPVSVKYEYEFYEPFHETTQTHNLSATGACIRTSREYAIGSLLSLTLDLTGVEGIDEQLRLYGEVRSCVASPAAKNRYRTGVVFKLDRNVDFNDITGGHLFELLVRFIQKEDIRISRVDRL